jgi:LysM repeat protein
MEFHLKAYSHGKSFSFPFLHKNDEIIQILTKMFYYILLFTIGLNVYELSYCDNESAIVRRINMVDYIKRFLIAGIMALFVSLLFLAGKQTQADTLDAGELSSHWIWPAEGTVTDIFGTRQGLHKGIDIAGEYGSLIFSVDEGTVVKSYFSETYGHVVFIKHPNQYETVYAHLKKRNVAEGQKVKQGQIIGEMGNTGDSSGIHLHFEVHKNEWTYEKENAINPELALGKMDIGQAVQVVFANRDSNKAIEAAVKLKEEDLMSNDQEVQDANLDRGKVSIIYRTVKEGDTLWSISKEENTTVAELMDLNHLTNDKIFPEQKLIIRNNK